LFQALFRVAAAQLRLHPVRHSGRGAAAIRTAEAGSRSEHRRSRWPEGRAPRMVRV